MSKYRKKPVVIEAFHMTKEAIDEAIKDRWLWPGWLREAWDKDRHDEGSLFFDYAMDNFLTITTLEGPHKVTPGDWIIKGVKGELYPCKPDIFEATYEAV